MGRSHEVMLTSLSNNRTSPKWTFSGRYGSTSRPVTPGPGAYGGTRKEGQGNGCPAWGFGTSTRDAARAVSAPAPVPGPGQYDCAAKNRGPTTPAHGFGSARRGSTSDRTTPGPGSYTLDRNKTGQDAPRYTATPRRNSNENPLNRRPSTPGPGAYFQARHEFRASSPEWGFGTSERDKKGAASIPGPGTYTESSSVGDGPKYSIRRKTDCRQGSKDQPGPGQYGGGYTQFGY